VSVSRSVRTRQYDLVAIKVTKPNLPMIRPAVSVWRVPVTGHDDFSTQPFGSFDCGVDVVYLEPEKQTVARRHVVRITDAPVVMLLPPGWRLQSHLTGMDKSFVVRPAVVTQAAEQPLIPSAARLDISDANQRLWPHHVASPYRTPSHTVGSSGVVQSTRC